MSNSYSAFVFVFFESNHQELKIGLRTYAFNFAQNKYAFVLFVSSSIFIFMSPLANFICVILGAMASCDEARPIYNLRIFCALLSKFAVLH